MMRVPAAIEITDSFGRPIEADARVKRLADAYHTASQPRRFFPGNDRVSAAARASILSIGKATGVNAAPFLRDMPSVAEIAREASRLLGRA